MNKYGGIISRQDVSSFMHLGVCKDSFVKLAKV